MESSLTVYSFQILKSVFILEAAASTLIKNISMPFERAAATRPMQTPLMRDKTSCNNVIMTFNL